MAPALSPVLSLASGVPMVALGALLVWLRPRRSEQVFFGLFSVLWGFKVIASNLGLVLDSAAVFEAAFLVNFALGPPAYVFLAQFTSRVHGGRLAFLFPIAMAGIAAIAVSVLLIDPSSVLAEVAVQADGSLGAVRLGEAAFPLFAVPFFGVFYLALAAVYRRYRQADPGSTRHRYRGMLIALALYTSYQTVTNLSNFVTGDLPTSVTGTLGQWLSQGLFLAGALVLVALVAHLLARPPDPGPRDWTLLASFLVPATVAFVTEAWDAIPTAARSWGLWRLLMVAVLVHTIARYRLFDLDLKLKRWAAPGLAVTAIGLAGIVALVQAADAGGLTAAAPPMLAGLATAGGLMVERDRVGRALFPEATEDPAYVDQRKREVYQAALEGVIDEGEDPDEDPLLADLRGSLDIPDTVHEMLVAQTRKPGSVSDGSLPPIEPGALVAERYKVDRLIGEGAHGRAFLAWDRDEERDVVLKVVGKPVLGGSAVDALLREAEILAGIDDPHVLDTYEVIEGRHELVLVAQYASGGSLADLVARRGRLGLPRAVEVTRQVLEGLQAAHDQGVVHRDVKPENILLDGDGEVLLADFGVARRGDDRDGTAVTAGPVGTLLYMSPEQVRGESVDERSDLYAAGVVFHRILTGAFYLPTSGADDFTLRRRILEEPPQLDHDEIPARVRAVLERALAKDRDDRFSSAAAMQEALREVATPAREPVAATG